MGVGRALGRICGWFGFGLLPTVEVEALRRERGELAQAVSEQRNELARIADQLDASEGSRARLKSKLEVTQQLAVRLRERRRRLEEELGALKAQGQQAFKAHKDLLRNVEEANLAIADLTGDLDGMKMALAVEQTGSKMLRKRLEKEASWKLRAVERHKAELKTLAKELKAASRQRDEIKQAIEAAAAERDAAIQIAAASDILRAPPLPSASRSASRDRKSEDPPKSSDEAMVARRSRAAVLFSLAESIQARGHIGLAVETYRKIGPDLADQISIRMPDGTDFSGPTFLIIGCARAGTTWLKQHLSTHPEIQLLAGEGLYFSSWPRVTPRAYVASYTSMSSRFLKKRHGGAPHEERVLPTHFGEKSPAYIDMSDEGIDLCAALFPNLRIICMVREPVSRAWSHIKHYGWARHADDLEFLKAPPSDSNLDEIVDHGRVEKHLRRWAKRFAPDQIHLVEFDKLNLDPRTVFDDILRHLGASPLEIPEEVLRDKPEASKSRQAPTVLLDYLHRVYAGERWDAESLRAAMNEAAGLAGKEQAGPKATKVQLAARRRSAGGERL
jgi:hypothetical protein